MNRIKCIQFPRDNKEVFSLLWAKSIGFFKLNSWSAVFAGFFSIVTSNLYFFPIGNFINIQRKQIFHQVR